MKNSQAKKSLSAEIEAVFIECKDHIDEAVRDYQVDIDSALEELKEELAR